MEKDAMQLGHEYPNTKISDDSKTKERILHEATCLFAQKGYADVSMKDIAQKVGIQPASIYNHFEGKEVLWQAILDNTDELYRLYFTRLEAARKDAGSFAEVLHTMFVELLDVVDIFTYYSFSLVQTEQFRDNAAGSIYLDVFLKYSIAYIKKRFDECVSQKLVPSFDTETVATFFMHSVLSGINVRVHHHMQRPTPYDVTNMFQQLEAYILRAANAGI